VRRAEKSFSIEIELRNFGLINEPARAFYGVMRVKDLAALYQEYDHALVRANIRRYRGSSQVNSGIIKTLTEAPAHFVYFNNGITLLCDKITLIGQTDTERNVGKFVLEGVSIINGAQTAGTVAQLPLAHYDTHEADVLVTCIQSTSSVEAFGDRVTEYRNSQNAVQTQDFIALDDNQENWRKTLQASGVTYIYKQSASDPHAADRVFTAQEAANYLAAVGRDKNAWIDGLVIARTEPARLWDRRCNFAGVAVPDADDSIYGKLFPSSLTARRLWRTTQIGRMVRDVIEADAPTQTPELAAMSSETVFLVAHIVFIRLNALSDANTLMLTTVERQTVSQEIDAVRLALDAAYAANDWGGVAPAAVFSDRSSLATLKGDVLRALKP
jgi:hypothetical protein